MIAQIYGFHRLTFSKRDAWGTTLYLPTFPEGMPVAQPSKPFSSIKPNRIFANMKNKAIFLDRDGVLNHEIYDYICKLEDFKVLDYQIPVLKKFYDEGYLLIVITNQGGIALNRYTEAQLAEMHEVLFAAFEAHGAKITKAYHCPHHPTVSEPCQCRKPLSGMILEAIATFDIDPALSVMIGDKPRDVVAAEGAGVKGILIEPDEQLDYDRIKEVLMM